ncbi:MAG: alanine racemase [Streptosporangiaceae bacterium]
MITDLVRAFLPDLAGHPAYVYDLAALGAHAAGIRAALPGTEFFYAAKANPDVPILRAVAPHVDGFEVASGGELEHVRRALPTARIAFGGPGKTDAELALAVRLGVERIHVESPYELGRLASMGETDVLLRVNLAGDRGGAALAMSGPFGMDPDLIGDCLGILARSPGLRLRGIHAHLASGLQVADALGQAAEILAWARPWLAAAGTPDPEINLGGGMGVDYLNPARRFDWSAYGQGVAALARPGETLRIEPGRSVTAHSGWYVTDVLDLKRSHGLWYAILRGGTHQFRTPVARHDQPFTVHRGPREPAVRDGPVTLVGQLCTPKDVFAREQPVEALAVGDQVAFAMAGAYAWNISHHDFLMHPKPDFHYLG